MIFPVMGERRREHATGPPQTPPAILFTQCLQKDFAKPLTRYETLPNRLHIGFQEARRLMGENPAEGAVAPMMEWAYRQSPSELLMVHLRDWHSLSASSSRGRHFIALDQLARILRVRLCDSVAEVRRGRTSRAVETRRQAKFVEEFA